MRIDDGKASGKGLRAGDVLRFGLIAGWDGFLASGIIEEGKGERVKMI